MNNRQADDQLWPAFLLSDGDVHEQAAESLLLQLEQQLDDGDTSLAEALGQIGLLRSTIKSLTAAEVAVLESHSSTGPRGDSHLDDSPRSTPAAGPLTGRRSRFSPLAVTACLLAVLAAAACLIHTSPGKFDSGNPAISDHDAARPAVDPEQIARAWKMTRGAWSSERLSDDLWEIAVSDAPDSGETVSDCRQVPGWMIAALSSEELDRQLRIPATGEAN